MTQTTDYVGGVLQSPNPWYPHENEARARAHANEVFGRRQANVQVVSPAGAIVLDLRCDMAAEEALRAERLAESDELVAPAVIIERATEAEAA